TDRVKGAAFTRASRAIVIAVKESGGSTDPEKNFRLRLAIEKARSVNMPKENITNAIQRAGGAGVGEIHEVVYEAFGPGNSALLITVATDNINRAVTAVKNVLEHHGGNLVQKGAVSYLFQRIGVLTFPRAAQRADQLFELAVTFGAEDVQSTADLLNVFVPLSILSQAKDAFTRSGVEPENIDIIYKPKVQSTLEASDNDKLQNLITALLELDDIQRVFSNST
ncbi:hypothetical protein A2154_00880, partial [Candidatus Gottesmanbacteria bacterium RBG_16_43_7]